MFSWRGKLRIYHLGSSKIWKKAKILLRCRKTCKNEHPQKTIVLPKNRWSVTSFRSLLFNVFDEFHCNSKVVSKQRYIVGDNMNYFLFILQRMPRFITTFTLTMNRSRRETMQFTVGFEIVSLQTGAKQIVSSD